MRMLNMVWWKPSREWSEVWLYGRPDRRRYVRYEGLSAYGLRATSKMFEKLRSSHRVRTYSGAARKTRTYGESLGIQFRVNIAICILSQ